MKCQIYFVKNPLIKPGPSYRGGGERKTYWWLHKNFTSKGHLYAPGTVGFAIPVPVAYRTRFPLPLAQGYVHRCPHQLLYFLSAVILLFSRRKQGLVSGMIYPRSGSFFHSFSDSAPEYKTIIATVATPFKVLCWRRQQCLGKSKKIITFLTVTVLFLFAFFILILNAPRTFHIRRNFTYLLFYHSTCTGTVRYLVPYGTSSVLIEV